MHNNFEFNLEKNSNGLAPIVYITKFVVGKIFHLGVIMTV